MFEDKPNRSRNLHITVHTIKLTLAKAIRTIFRCCFCSNEMIYLSHEDNPAVNKLRKSEQALNSFTQPHSIYLCHKLDDTTGKRQSCTTTTHLSTESLSSSPLPNDVLVSSLSPLFECAHPVLIGIIRPNLYHKEVGLYFPSDKSTCGNIWVSDGQIVFTCNCLIDLM